ncbi:TPA: lanthionine synthetase LanC family protein [Streptococcus pyogenes]
MIKAQLKNLIKTIHLVKEAGFSLLVFSIAISLFQGILPIFSMLLVQKMLNIITTDIKNFHTLMIAFISYIALTLLTIIIGEVDSYIDTKLQILLHYKMNHLVMQKTVKLTLAEFETPEIYDDITRIQNQISYKPFQIYKSIISVLSSLVSLISSFVILLNWKISIFPLLLILPIVSIYIYLKIGKNEFEILYKRSSDERANWYISHLLTHDFAVKELRLGTLESYFLKKYDKNNQLFINQENSINRSKMKYGIVLGVLEIAIQSIIMFLAVREAFLGILLVGNVMFLFRRDDKLWPGKIYTSNILDLDLNYLPTRMAWCYGTPGTAVALFKMCQLIDLNFIDDINESLIAQMRSSDKNVYSLTMCHGLAGVTFIYDLIGKNYSSERLTRFAEELRQQIITSFSTTKVFGYTDREKFGEIEVELESIGILQGVSGIVLFLLNPYSDEELLWQRIFI